MSAKSLILFSTVALVALSVANTTVAAKPPVVTFENSLGPEVIASRL